VARRVTAELGDALGVRLPRAARPGADLHARVERGLDFPAPGCILRARDGWVHPGPPTAWSAFTAMACSLGARPVPGQLLPEVRAVDAEALDAEAGVWRLPAVAVRGGPSAPVAVPARGDPADASEAVVLVLGTAWAAPLAGLVLAGFGARVIRVDHPRRPDPFPLDAELALGQERVALDLDVAADRDTFAQRLASADVLVDATTPRVLANAGLGRAERQALVPRLAEVRLAAFVDEDRPGYGLAAECRAGWASRHDPPCLARTSLADPVAGLVVALAVLDVLGGRGPREARVTLEGAAGLLLERERDG
jgi:hypothetical protein